MTLPGSDARSQRTTIPRRPQIIASPTSFDPASPHSIPDLAQDSSQAASLLSASARSASIRSQSSKHEHALDFATHSWDLATGGLKTLTAKREIPMRPERRVTGVVPDIVATSRSYMFALVIFVCVVLILIGGGIVLFVLLL